MFFVEDQTIGRGLIIHEEELSCLLGDFGNLQDSICMSRDIVYDTLLKPRRLSPIIHSPIRFLTFLRHSMTFAEEEGNLHSYLVIILDVNANKWVSKDNLLYMV